MIERLKLNWHKSVNFGDQLNPYLAKKIWNLDAVKIEEGSSEDHLMMIGSILNEANSHSLVFGSGFVTEHSFFDGNPKILSVRGELTRKVLASRGYPKNQIRIGDPAILLPDFYNPSSREKKFKLGVIPHIIDYEKGSDLFKNMENCILINLRLSGDEEITEIEKIIDDINSCECIISSSLHGLIVAHSYGIPGAWCEFSDRVIGGGFKFRDYFSAHTKNYESIQCLNLKDTQKIDSLDEIIKTASQILIETERDKAQVYDIINELNSRTDFKELYSNRVLNEI